MRRPPAVKEPRWLKHADARTQSLTTQRKNPGMKILDLPKNRHGSRRPVETENLADENPGELITRGASKAKIPQAAFRASRPPAPAVRPGAPEAPKHEMFMACGTRKKGHREKKSVLL